MARRNWKVLRTAADAVIADARKARREQSMGQPFAAAALRWKAARRATMAEVVVRNVAGLEVTTTLGRYDALRFEDFLQ